MRNSQGGWRAAEPTEDELCELNKCLSLIFKTPAYDPDSGDCHNQLKQLNLVYARKLIEFSDRLSQANRMDPLFLQSKFRQLFELFKGNSRCALMDLPEVVLKVFKYTKNLIAIQKRQSEQLQLSLREKKSLEDKCLRLQKQDSDTRPLSKSRSQLISGQLLVVKSQIDSMLSLTADNDHCLFPEKPYYSDKDADLLVEEFKQRLSVLHQRVQALVSNKEDLLRVRQQLVLVVKKHLLDIERKLLGRDVKSCEERITGLKQFLQQKCSKSSNGVFEELKEQFEQELDVIRSERQSERTKFSLAVTKLQFMITELRSISEEVLRTNLAKELNQLKKIYEPRALQPFDQELEGFKVAVLKMVDSQFDLKNGQIARLNRLLKLAQEKHADLEKRRKFSEEGLAEAESRFAVKVRQKEALAAELGEERQRRKQYEKQLRQQVSKNERQGVTGIQLQNIRRQSQQYREQLRLGLQERNLMVQRARGLEKRLQKEKQLQQHSAVRMAELTREVQFLNGQISELTQQNRELGESLGQLRKIMQSQKSLIDGLQRQQESQVARQAQQQRSAQEHIGFLENQLRKFREYDQINRQELQVLQNQIQGMAVLKERVRESQEHCKGQFQEFQKLKTQLEKALRLVESKGAQIMRLTGLRAKEEERARQAQDKSAQLQGLVKELQVQLRGREQLVRQVEREGEGVRDRYQILKQQMGTIVEMLLEQSRLQDQYQRQVQSYKEQLGQATRRIKVEQ